MGITTDRNDPRLGHGADETPRPQNEVYLVLSEEERAKGFVRPFRDTYVHRGARGPKYPLRDLDQGQREAYGDEFAKYEEYPFGVEATALGKFWTQAELDNVGKGCGTPTTMGRAIAETYAREPHFYGSTYCVCCSAHRPVDEFVWAGTDERVGS